jgi:protein gp37
MNKTKIEWTDWTWNPVTGCKHGCSYCYARRIAMRFTKHFKPTFYEERLIQPYRRNKSSKIFVCSMADLFGDWVPKAWIWQILDVVRMCDWHTFQFLTKNPKRYDEFNFPGNCWLGVTIDYPNQKKIDLLNKKKFHYKFISFEPILDDMSSLDLSGIDLCIIGRDTSPGAELPKQEWIDSVKHQNIFLKKNLRQRVVIHG